MPDAEGDQQGSHHAAWFGRSPHTTTDTRAIDDLLHPFAARPPLAPQLASQLTPPLAPQPTAVGFDDTTASRTPETPYRVRAAVAVEPLWARATDPAKAEPAHAASGGQGMAGGSGTPYWPDDAAEAPQSAAARPHGRAKGRGRPRLLIRPTRLTGPLGVGAVSGLIVASSMLTSSFTETVPSWVAAQADRSTPDGQYNIEVRAAAARFQE
ncbi:MAG TPA: hypothetical protein VFH94_12015 [Streptomyces sp.]|nr:hypothetical protein [Streptomyces sp.]